MNNFNFDLDNNVDEDFFGSLKGSKSSKLQQLFVEENLSADDKQQTLKYQRPKANELKNKEIKNVSTSNNSSITLIAKVVTAYRQGELQGKVGMALIQNSDSTYNIIMYKTKSYILASLKLIVGEDFLYKRTQFWQFYDEESIYWSFSFDTKTDEEEFKEKLNDKKITYKEGQEKEQQGENSFNLENVANEDHSEIIAESFNKPVEKCVTNDSKNSLIKRVAKMGKPLPTLSSYGHQTTTEFSDSSDTEVIKTPLAAGQKPSIAPRSIKLSTSKTNQQLAHSMGAYNTPAATASAVYPINHLESQYMQLLLTEHRTQGSELRMNMNKLENKIEKVLDKLELYERTDVKKNPDKDDEILELEEKLLMLKKENRKLKQHLQEQSVKETEENKVKELINEFNDDLIDLDIDFKQDSKSLLRELIEKFKESIKKRQELQEHLNENKLNFRVKLKDLESKTSKITELENELSLLKQEEADLKLKLNEQESEILKQKQELLDLQIKLKEKVQESSKTPDDTLVKSIMNNLYVDINNKLENINLPQSEEVLAIIAASIRQQTSKYLQQLKTK